MKKKKVTVALRKVAQKRIQACRSHLARINRQPKTLNPMHWSQIKKFLMFLLG